MAWPIDTGNGIDRWNRADGVQLASILSALCIATNQRVSLMLYDGSEVTWTATGNAEPTASDFNTVVLNGAALRTTLQELQQYIGELMTLTSPATEYERDWAIYPTGNLARIIAVETWLWTEAAMFTYAGFGSGWIDLDSYTSVYDYRIYAQMRKILDCMYIPVCIRGSHNADFDIYYEDGFSIYPDTGGSTIDLTRKDAACALYPGAYTDILDSALDGLTGLSSTVVPDFTSVSGSIGIIRFEVRYDTQNVPCCDRDGGENDNVDRPSCPLENQYTSWISRVYAVGRAVEFAEWLNGFSDGALKGTFKEFILSTTAVTNTGFGGYDLSLACIGETFTGGKTADNCWIGTTSEPSTIQIDAESYPVAQFSGDIDGTAKAYIYSGAQVLICDASSLLTDRA